MLPLLLIGVGIVFLLSNLGYIAPVSARAVLQLWPLLLILIGVDILLARRSPVAALAIELAVVALGFALLVTRGAFTGF